MLITFIILIVYPQMTFEGGVSLTLGNDFSILSNITSKELFSIKLGIILD